MLRHQMVHNEVILTTILKGSNEMKTKEQIKQEFMQDLKALLEKYDAEISAEDIGYAPCIEISVPQFNSDGLIDDYIEIELGNSINKNDM